jgi:hypothetical protein
LATSWESPRSYHGWCFDPLPRRMICLSKSLLAVTFCSEKDWVWDWVWNNHFHGAVCAGPSLALSSILWLVLFVLYGNNQPYSDGFQNISVSRQSDWSMAVWTSMYLRRSFEQCSVKRSKSLIKVAGVIFPYLSRHFLIIR